MPLKERLKGVGDRIQRAGWFVVIRAAVRDWIDDHAPDHAAAVAYYSLFGLAPLIIIAVAVAGFFYGHDAAREQMLGTAGQLVGEQGKEGLRVLLENASRPGAGILATLIGVGALLFAATNVFAHLKRALNAVWEVEERPGLGWRSTVRERVMSLGLVLAVGFLLLVSLVAGAVLSAAVTHVQGILPGLGRAWLVGQTLVSLAISTLVFGALLKVLPNVDIGWRQVGHGAFLTAVLFEVGRLLLGFYLGGGSLGGTYGAAGSVLVLLAWLYYSGLIFFFGAELTQVLARHRGEPVTPDAKAVRVGERTLPRRWLGNNPADRDSGSRRGSAGDANDRGDASDRDAAGEGSGGSSR